jgi:predicted RNase H-like HicB family nuclease
MSYRIRLLETDEGWSVSCLDLPGCHSQGDTSDEALANIREAIQLWLEVETEEAGVKRLKLLKSRSDLGQLASPALRISTTRLRIVANC